MRSSASRSTSWKVKNDFGLRLVA